MNQLKQVIQNPRFTQLKYMMSPAAVMLGVIVIPTVVVISLTDSPEKAMQDILGASTMMFNFYNFFTTVISAPVNLFNIAHNISDDKASVTSRVASAVVDTSAFVLHILAPINPFSMLSIPTRNLMMATANIIQHAPILWTSTSVATNTQTVNQSSKNSYTMQYNDKGEPSLIIENRFGRFTLDGKGGIKESASNTGSSREYTLFDAPIVTHIENVPGSFTQRVTNRDRNQSSN